MNSECIALYKIHKKRTPSNPRSLHIQWIITEGQPTSVQKKGRVHSKGICSSLNDFTVYIMCSYIRIPAKAGSIVKGSASQLFSTFYRLLPVPV